MKYIKLFDTHSEYEAAQSSLILPNVSFCKDTPNEVHYNPTVGVTSVTLNKSELSLSKGATETLVATVLPSNASNKNVTWSSSNDSVATVSNNGLVTAVGGGNVNITVTTVDGGYTAQCACNIIDPCASEKVKTTYEWVEIGGIKWATKNVGALTVTDYGQKFSWGGVNGYTNEQVSGGCHAFSWADYELGNGGSSATDMTKYNSTDGKTVLEASDDAATVNMGSGWRIPTEADFNTLSAATTNAWVTDYQGSGINGRLFTDKTDNTKVLFFPAAGYWYDGSVYGVGSSGYYWSSSLNTSNVVNGRRLVFDSGFCRISYFNRRNGYAVRGVVDE